MLQAANLLAVFFRSSAYVSVSGQGESKRAKHKAINLAF